MGNTEEYGYGDLVDAKDSGFDNGWKIGYEDALTDVLEGLEAIEPKEISVVDAQAHAKLVAIVMKLRTTLGG
jgi:hypothetical protein